MFHRPCGTRLPCHHGAVSKRLVSTRRSPEQQPRRNIVGSICLLVQWVIYDFALFFSHADCSFGTGSGPFGPVQSPSLIGRATSA